MTWAEFKAKFEDADRERPEKRYRPLVRRTAEEIAEAWRVFKRECSRGIRGHHYMPLLLIMERVSGNGPSRLCDWGRQLALDERGLPVWLRNRTVFMEPDERPYPQPDDLRTKVTKVTKVGEESMAKLATLLAEIDTLDPDCAGLDVQGWELRRSRGRASCSW